MMPHITIIPHNSVYYKQGYRWKVKTRDFTLCVRNFKIAFRLLKQKFLEELKMRIIKEGKNPNELPCTCNGCGCEFIADKREDFGYCEIHSSYFVTCPCCGREFYILDFEAKRLKY